MSITRFVILFSLLLGSGQLLASSNRVYMAPMETSAWVLVEDGPLRCEIEHVIPRFGKAVFYQESGRQLRLRIETHQHYRENLEVSFRSVTANWKGMQTESHIAKLKSGGGRHLVRVAPNPARHAYFELQQGYQPSLFFFDPEDAMQAVSVVMSTVNFREVEAKFSMCLSNLHPYHFDDVRMARVHFEFDEEFPKIEEEERALKKMLDYLKVDQDVKTLVISGHADFKGTECYNDDLSARRAWYVYDYLVQSGIEPNRLQVEFFGESRPLKKGRDDQSRALNRRVTVTMHK